MDSLEFLSGGGEMGERTRTFDWPATSIGSAETWPPSLRTTLSIILNSRFPMILWWGEDLVQFYNDAYRFCLNEKHPSALGQKGKDCWLENWNALKSQIDQVLEKGDSVLDDDQLIPIYKNRQLEDVYWTFSYSPVKNEFGKIEGILVVGAENPNKFESPESVFASDVMFQTFGAQANIFRNQTKTHNYYNLINTPIFDSDEKVIAGIAKSKKNLQDTILKTPVAMCIFKGNDHTVEIANQKMLELWGKEEKQVTGKPILQGLPKTIGQVFKKSLDKVYETGETIKAYGVSIALPKNKDAKIVYVDFLFEAFREPDGLISGIIAVAIDVTENFLAHKKIEQAEEKARLAMESADLGSYEVNLLTNEIQTSERFNSIWGIGHSPTRDELTKFIHPDDAPIREEAYKKAIETGNLDYETRLIREEQSIHWVRIKGKMLFDANRIPVTLLGVIQDITEQKNFAEQLTKQVKERTLELFRSNQDLLQFAHVASHDLKEPVRKIKIFSNMLQNEYGELLPERAIIYLDKIQSATDRMFSMIEGVLAYSEFTAAEQKIDWIDLNKIIENIESDLEILIEQKHAIIKKEKLPVIQGASVLIHQLFYNLINNALKFSKTAVPSVIEISSSVEKIPDVKDNEMVTIVITDNGIGLDAQFANKIFEVFLRLNSKDDYEGTGLGLALCQKIVERHHGSITAHGVKGEKAVFTVKLPAKQHFEIV